MKPPMRSSDPNIARAEDMKTRKSIDAGTVLVAMFFLLAVALWIQPAQVSASAPQAAQQKQFATPEEAMNALVTAGKAKDTAALAGIFGADYDKLLSGDPVQDSSELDHFASALEQSAKLEKSSDTKFTLAIGKDNWPFPIPIVKTNDQWRFDTAAGMNEILTRRIGENELSTIAVARAYVLAQWEYFTEGDHDNDGVAEYAQKFISGPGQKDGLFWETAEGEKPSPLGALVAEARVEGYSAGQHKVADTAKNPATPRQRSPYHGYYFKILKSQGPHAPGGKYGYVINGNMIAGYALIAYPDKWGSSGVMTFIVNQQGRVYQKYLGPTTDKLAPAIVAYDPDGSWKLVKE
ncbi:MAG TPA: DUF2950 domain-containing protein [Alphaproteobacteria bacterium]|nr:DUF2950 domain-containing protein [Alphaproteobacteria bacterium]